MSTTQNDNEAEAASYERQALAAAAKADMFPTEAAYWRQQANRYNQLANRARHGGA